MTQTLTFPARSEIVEFDHETLSRLCERHGPAVEGFLTDCLLQIGQQMDRARVQLCQGDTAALDLTCAGLATLADTIGMRTVGLAARAVRDAIARSDATALAACGTRMVRLGHPSTIESWTVRTGMLA